MTNRRLQDRYELTHVVGRGGMAQVWAARDLDQGRQVAVKTVEVGDEPGRLARLRAEARLTAAVDHPGVVDVHDVGVHDATAFLVMDLLPGSDLAGVLRDGPLPLETALRVATGVSAALAATHGAGVVHRDIKPANVVLHRDRATLIDFGIAASGCAQESGRLTFGTAQYMAPEQVTAGPVLPAADMYAFGCLLTALVSGRPPFRGARPMEVLRHHVRALPPRLTDLAPGAPARLEDLVAALLAKDPGHRPTAEEARSTLEDLLTSPTRNRAPAPAARFRPVPRTAGAGAGVLAAVPTARDVPDATLDPEATAPMLVALDDTGALPDDVPHAA